MYHKIRKEWFLKTKWGRVAMISWGDRHRPGVLLVHGYLDSAATFEPLLSLLPDTHHYVGFDFPGHGKSDHLSTGPLVPKGFFIEIIKEIIHYLQWKSFICISHSMGYLIVSLYHHLYPGRVKKMINLDPVYPTSQYYHLNDNLSFWFKWFFEFYYDHFDLYLDDAPPKLFTREKLIESTMKIRKLNREQAELVLSRSLVPVENGLYRITTQPLMRRLISIPAFGETFYHIMTHNAPPSLNLHGMKTDISGEQREFAKPFFSDNNRKQTNVYFDAPHDLHITNAHDLVPHIVEFMNGKKSKAKL